MVTVLLLPLPTLKTSAPLRVSLAFASWLVVVAWEYVPWVTSMRVLLLVLSAAPVYVPAPPVWVSE